MSVSSELMPVTLVKWGGGLITDKARREHVERSVLERLARELAAGLVATPESLVLLGHGSGSFGHWSARDSFLARAKERTGRLEHEQLSIASATADAAARLHRQVVAAVLSAGAAPFSWIPSSSTLEGSGDTLLEMRTLRQALVCGFLPVTGGDVVLSSKRGAVIWSTERVFEAIVDRSETAGFRVNRVIWLGNTDGVLDASGSPVSQVSESNVEMVSRLVGGSDGVDVTGGMRLRFDACRRLAGLGVESWVLDGRQPGVLEKALGGQRVGGTAFLASS